MKNKLILNTCLMETWNNIRQRFTDDTSIPSEDFYIYSSLWVSQNG